jgi:diguanylate cyclase (GGDEF)-like protein
MVDDLTGLYNRVYFERQFPIELAKAQRAKSPLGCLILGIDRFREIVQQHGYAAAEEVLSHAAASLGRTCPTEHVVCRYAEEQFGVLAFDSDVPRAVELAERLREGVKASPASYENTPLDVTVSVGLSVSRLSCDEGVAFEAEEALSRARHGGGDCVMVGGRWVELRLANQSTKRCQCN